MVWTQEGESDITTDAVLVSMWDVSRLPWSVQICECMVATLACLYYASPYVPLYVSLCVSIRSVGWKNKPKMERGVNHSETLANATPKTVNNFPRLIDHMGLPIHNMEVTFQCRLWPYHSAVYCCFCGAALESNQFPWNSQ